MASKKRTNPQDVSNLFIRCLLCDISLSFGVFSDEQQRQTLEYFDYKCPYTGEDIREAFGQGKCDLDHIIGHNRQDCGLHVYGNLVLTKKGTNASKSSMDFERFIRTKTNGTDAEKQERIDKIKRFMDESGYARIHQSCVETIQAFAQEEYDKIVEMTRINARELANKLGVEFVEDEPRRGARTNRYISELESEFWFWISDRVSENTKAQYQSALHRIIDEVNMGFDNFAFEVHERLPLYLSNGERAASGNYGSGSGRAALEKLDLFMIERDGL